jgi:hypothetical protein
MGEERKVYKVLVGKPEGRRPLGRPRHRWEDGVRMDLREIGLGGIVISSQVLFTMEVYYTHSSIHNSSRILTHE